jgi:type VI secretion system secreted protein VgrG
MTASAAALAAHRTAQTDVALEAGISRIALKADGTITVKGRHANVIGSDRIDPDS